MLVVEKPAVTEIKKQQYKPCSIYFNLRLSVNWIGSHVNAQLSLTFWYELCSLLKTLL